MNSMAPNKFGDPQPIFRGFFWQIVILAQKKCGSVKT
jgi:hypothetical protein